MLSKYNNVLLSVILTGIVGIVAYNVIYRYWVQKIACTGASPENYITLCQSLNGTKETERFLGGSPKWTPEEKQVCWCAQNV
jgi:hypothetical protein